jgi:hypothetical protein
MRLLRAHTRLGALPPNPQDLPLFFPPEWSSLFWISRGQEHSLSPAFPAAEPVARVASQCQPAEQQARRVRNPSAKMGRRSGRKQAELCIGAYKSPFLQCGSGFGGQDSGDGCRVFGSRSRLGDCLIPQPGRSASGRVSR